MFTETKIGLLQIECLVQVSMPHGLLSRVKPNHGHMERLHALLEVHLVWRRIGPQAQCQHLRKVAAWKNRLQLANQTQLEQLLFN